MRRLHCRYLQDTEMLSRRTKKASVQVPFQDEKIIFTGSNDELLVDSSNGASTGALNDNKISNNKNRRKTCRNNLSFCILMLVVAGTMKLYKGLGMILVNNKNSDNVKEGVIDVAKLLSSFREGIQQNKKEQGVDEGKISHQSSSMNEKNEGHLNEKCSFRSYPPNRFYNLFTPYEDLPSFLSTEALYIRGMLPVLLDEKLQTKNVVRPQKVCIDTSEWEKPEEGTTSISTRPFTDGQNPCFVSLAPHPYKSVSTTTVANELLPRLDQSHIRSIVELFHGQVAAEDLLLVAAVFGDGQCKWKMSLEEIARYNFSNREKAPSHRTVIAVLHAKTFENLGQTTLLLEQDASWGRQRSKKVENSDAFVRSVQQFDDARFFFHDGYVWVLYRNGPMFGYNDQIQNRLHFEWTSKEGFVVYIKASETITVCCGRNMAFFTEAANRNRTPDSLKVLTWVDVSTMSTLSFSIGEIFLSLLAS
jgi:hypothetical protein